MSEYVESRRSPGTKKCWSSNWLFVMDDGVVGMGIGGTGGTSRPGEDELVRLVTPGMYAICIMLDALVRTVEAME
jgi:hypothetical protein